MGMAKYWESPVDAYAYVAVKWSAHDRSPQGACGCGYGENLCVPLDWSTHCALYPLPLPPSPSRPLARPPRPPQSPRTQQPSALPPPSCWRPSLADLALVELDLTVAVGEWSSSTASCDASTLALDRASISSSKVRSAAARGSRCSPRTSCERRARASATASRSAWLAPWPLKGDIGWAASPMRVTRVLGAISACPSPSSAVPLAPRLLPLGRLALASAAPSPRPSAGPAGSARRSAMMGGRSYAGTPEQAEKRQEGVGGVGGAGAGRGRGLGGVRRAAVRARRHITASQYDTHQAGAHRGRGLGGVVGFRGGAPCPPAP
eukprot:scaffold29501_cov100-Isochrysis_galbana.AAC.1